MQLCFLSKQKAASLCMVGACAQLLTQDSYLQKEFRMRNFLNSKDYVKKASGAGTCHMQPGLKLSAAPIWVPNSAQPWVQQCCLSEPHYGTVHHSC
jgi:hypothetical protein